MLRILLGISIAALTCGAAFADTAERSHAYDDFIAQQAKKHGVPERLVHRILVRESRYDPKVFHNHCYGLMQIKYGTAREMGYHGAPKGLFDPYVNMTYAIPYLANAYKIAQGDEDRAVALFAGGYYYAAKQKQMLAVLRTADSPPLAPDPTPALLPPEPSGNPMADLFAFLQTPAQNPVRTAEVQVAAALGQPAATAPQPTQTASTAPAGTQQAQAEQARASEDATASISAAPQPAETKSRDKAGSLRTAHKAAKTKIALAGNAAEPAQGTKAAPSATQQAEAEQARASEDATASISAAPQPTVTKSHDKAGSPKTAHKAAKTKLALAGNAAEPPEGANAAPQPTHKVKEAKSHAIATAAATPTRDEASEAAPAAAAGSDAATAQTHASETAPPAR